LERVLLGTGTDVIEARVTCLIVRWLPLLSRERAIDHADSARGLDSGNGVSRDPRVANAAGALWDRRLLRIWS